MFRDVVRKKQKLNEDECISILKTEKRGVLSVIGDDGYPYGMPLNHFYNEDDGKIYFHSGKTGHKIDAMRSCEKASFCVYDSGIKSPDSWILNFKSVVVFGRIEFIEDNSKAIEISRQLSLKFTDDEDYIKKEIAKFKKSVRLFAVHIDHLSGKIVNES